MWLLKPCSKKPFRPRTLGLSLRAGIRRIPCGAREGTRPPGAGVAGDLLEGVGRVVVLAGEDRPLARDEQLSRPGRYPGAEEALEDLPLGRDPKGRGSPSSAESSSKRLWPRQGNRSGPVRSWWASHSAGSVSPPPGLGRVAMVDQGHAAAAGVAGACARGVHLGRRGERRAALVVGAWFSRHPQGWRDLAGRSWLPDPSHKHPDQPTRHPNRARPTT
jgi:hypothetical protein